MTAAETVVIDPSRVAAVRLAASLGPSRVHREAMSIRASRVLRPAGAFARLDEVAVWLAGWQGSDRPTVERPGVLIFAADHGVAARGVSAYPAEATAAMTQAIERRVATCSALAHAQGASLTLIDVGVGRPTNDLAVDDAMDHDRFEASWAAGVEAVAGLDADVLILGELGIGNTTSAAAVAACLLGGAAGEWAGRGTGVDDDGLGRKVDAIDAGIRRVGQGTAAPLEVLRRLGGAELVAMAGAAVEARRRRLPIVLDGFITTAALLPLELTAPGALDHVVAGHVSAEGAHRRLLEHLGKRPLIELDLRLGEASGALIALPLLRLAVAAVVDVATFGEFSTSYEDPIYEDPIYEDPIYEDPIYEDPIYEDPA